MNNWNKHVLIFIFAVFLLGTVNYSWGEPSSTNSESSGISFTEKIKFPVEKYQLKNGLTVLLYENHLIPQMSIQQWFRVGSANEKIGHTGMAHFFEHLMFKGTTKYSSEALERMIQENGGDNNAFTTQDYTGYYENMPSGTLEMILDIESDRLHNLLFDPKAITSEREVVKEERRMRVENSIFGILNELTFSTVFKVLPYRWPVIGSMDDLNATSDEDFKDFYRHHYAPNNAVLVVAGDFDSKMAKKWINKYYDPIPEQSIPEITYSPEPPQKGERVSSVVKEVQNVTVCLAYQGEATGQGDEYALDLIANLLGEGTSSRLHKKLVYGAQIADAVQANSLSLKLGGLFRIFVSLHPGVDGQKALPYINSEIWKLRNETVSNQELEKAKTQVMLDYISSLKTVSGKARGLALNETLFGDYNRLFKDLDQYQKVTAEQIKLTAEKYLRPEKRSVIQIKPRTVPHQGV